MSAGAATTVLGLGNPLYADEGAGVAALQRLCSTVPLSEGVAAVDGGTQGVYLLPAVQAADRLLVLDAVDFGAAPGTLHVLRNDEVPRFGGAQKLDLHQTTFMEVLQMAELLAGLPHELVLIGLQPERLGPFGSGLTPTVAGQLDAAVAAARAELAAWDALAPAAAGAEA